MLVISYNPLLIVGAAAVALMSAYAGLSLTNGLSQEAFQVRQVRIVRAAIVLGGGIWSTHFVAMLALDLPVLLFYDPLRTLVSAFIAILLVGVALLLLHFGQRSQLRIIGAGLVMAAGVVTMHFVGMSAIEGCDVRFLPVSYLLSSLIAGVMSVGALHLAYRRRSAATIAAGAALFAAAILAMHFSAMLATQFFAVDGLEPRANLVSDDTLALVVVTSAFVISGLFLLSTAATMEAGGSKTRKTEMPVPVAEADPQPFLEEPPQPASAKRVPYEADGVTFFLPASEIVAVHSEGHYCQLVRAGGSHFCPMSISKLYAELEPEGFLRTHRSHLVNLAHVTGFERKKDQGLVHFGPRLGVPPVPVSRANVPKIIKALGL